MAIARSEYARLRGCPLGCNRCRSGLSIIVGALIALASLGNTSLAPAADNTPDGIEFFEKEIRPLLVTRCFECHGDLEKVKAGLKLTSRAAILSGGESGPAASPGKPTESLLIEAIKYRGIDMPPKGKMPETEIAKLERWVEMGMPWPEGAAPEKPATEEKKEESTFTISDAQRSHWSFQPLHVSAPPDVKDAAWCAGPIDRFVLAGLEARGLHPNALADKRTLLRRVTFDLTGLPPKPEDAQAFFSDESPEAYAKVIDRLLASPQYGERWGRHWLDVVRYSDTAGETGDYPIPQARKYRDYVITAFNQDKPYDHFVREQLAGDLLADEGPGDKAAERIVATGYIAISRRFGFDPQNYMHLTIGDTIDNLGRTFLGLSVGCARCHDHKYDPLAAKDYYALYGIFASTKYSFPGAEETKRPKDMIPMLSREQIETVLKPYEASLAATGDQVKKLTDEQNKLKGSEAQLVKDIGWEGDFESQPIGGGSAAPWLTENGKFVAEAQSPFINVYAAGTRSAVGQ